jgi:hypothetical protein
VAAVQYTFTHKQYTERHKTNNTQNNTKIFGRVRALPRLCDLYSGICLTTEEKARKNLSQGSRRVPAGTMKTEYTEQNIHNNKKYIIYKIEQKHTKHTTICTGCPTRYRTRHFFNNSNTNEDIATKFEQEYVRCVRNEEECVCSAPNSCDTEQPSASQPGSVANGTLCTMINNGTKRTWKNVIDDFYIEKFYYNSVDKIQFKFL